MVRKLRKGERELWDRVKETIQPHHLTRPKFDMSEVAETSFEAPEAPRIKLSVEKLTNFKVGSQSKPAAPSTHHPRSYPIMDAKTFGKMLRGRLTPQARLDLHGMTLDEAHVAVVNFIMSCSQRQLRLALIITGKGRPNVSHGFPYEKTGVLKRFLPIWLQQAPLKQIVLESSLANQKHGGNGAFYVYLRRK